MSQHHHATLNIIHQVLKEEGYHETVHTFERESNFHFDRKYFSDLVMNGKWDEAESYLSGFIKVDENKYSMSIYYEIRKEKFLEALDKKEHDNALEILDKDLKYIQPSYPCLYSDLTNLLTIEDVRNHPRIIYYKDAMSGRSHAVEMMNQLIDMHPQFREKLVLPELANESVLKNMLARDIDQTQVAASSSSHPPIMPFDLNLPWDDESE